MMTKKKNRNQTSPGAKKSKWALVWIRFRKNKLAMVGLTVLVILLLAALLAPLYIDYSQVRDGSIRKRSLCPHYLRRADFPFCRACNHGNRVFVRHYLRRLRRIFRRKD